MSGSIRDLRRDGQVGVVRQSESKSALKSWRALPRKIVVTSEIRVHVCANLRYIRDAFDS
jgi:hypothetical protein